jgi:DNA polymerase I-like protein with 3'-5' exonuclease and polymerase domains
MMASEYNLIVEPAGVPRVVESLRAEAAIGFDTETTGLDPHTKQLRLIQVATPRGVEVFDCFRLRPEALAPLCELLAAPRPIKIAHNAKFDAKFLMKNFGVRLGGIFDTYLASQLISAGDDRDRHGLEPVVNRFLQIELDKSAQTSDWSGDLSPAQLEYAARDAAVLLPLRETQQAALERMGLERVAQLEFECVLSVAAMELAGFHLDVGMWRELIANIRVAHERITEELQRELGAGVAQMSLFDTPPEINLDSPAQVREALAAIGIEVEDTREWTLQKLARQHQKGAVLGRLLEHRGLSRSLSSYGENILGFLNPATRRLHADFRQIGTPTGRLTTSSPSLQQIPHSVEYRSCFRAPAGRKLVVADYGQIEMRVVADVAQDEALLTAFESGADLHRTTASEMFGVPLDQVTKRQRESAKGLNYGFVYGMGAEGLANRIECSLPEAQALIERYFAAYPGIARWLENAAQTAVRTRESRTVTGRMWRFQLDPNDRSQIGALKRVGKNAPIQGTASDIFKRAMTRLDAALAGRDAQIVNSIHDEIVVECDEAIAEDVLPLVKAKMIEGAREFLRRVPIEVEAGVADAWVKQ